MAVPLVLHGTGLVFLIAALFQTGIPYMSVKQVGGTGRIDYSILGTPAVAKGLRDSCARGRELTPPVLQARV